MMKLIDIHARLEYDKEKNKYNITDCIKDMEENGIERRVVSALHGLGISEQNEAILEASEMHEGLIPCAVINPKDPNYINETKKIIQEKKFKFIEFHSLYHGYYPEKMEKELIEIFNLIRETDIVVKVFTGHGFFTVPDQWAYYASQFPEITFLIEHLGGTDFSYGTIDLSKEVDNLIFDLSYETELPVLKRAFREIPVTKLFYGSNYPDNFTDLSILKYLGVDIDESLKEDFYYNNAINLLNTNRN